MATNEHELRAALERELDELMMSAENYFGAKNPKRRGHISCALDRIVNVVQANLQRGTNG